MIYIHVPFCRRKCTYCAFFSRPLHNDDALRRYVDALLAEMQSRKDEQHHPIRTVYFGGGTPSLLSIDHLARIVDALRRCFDLSRLEEATLEANPEDLTPSYLADLAALGFFNRLSIGIQSLDDTMLRLIGRRHTAAQAIDALENAHRSGFSNISVDFIYGLPANFPLSTFHFPLVTHLSAYALTVEPGTALALQVEQGRVQLPDEDDVVLQYHALHGIFEAAGFRQYEVSNYSRPGYESRHNSRYWDRTPYLGLGPGAHSFDGHVRRWNNSDLGLYCNSLLAAQGSVPVDYYQQERLSDDDAYNELLMTSLRTVRGLPLSLVPDAYKKELHRKMQLYIGCGWIVADADAYRPTAEGLLHADGMAANLFVA